MRFTLNDLRPTEITPGLAGSSFNSTHLTRTYGVDKPHDLSVNASNMAMLFAGTDRYNGKPLTGMLEGKAKKLALTSRDYTWKLQGYKKRQATIMELITTGTDRLGENQDDIVVVLDTAQFKYPDVLAGEDEDYPLEIIGKPEKRNNYYEYTLRLQTDNPRAYIPSHVLQPGKEMGKVSSSVADEMNQDYGTMQFNTIYELRGTMGNAAVEHRFTDKALRVDKNSNEPVQKLKHWRVPFMNNNNKTYYNFMPMVEAEMWDTLYRDIEWGLTYGRSSARMVKGFLKKTCAGLRQQIETSNRLFHQGNLSITRLEDFFSDIYRGRTDASPSQRKVVLDTGEEGAKMFDRMVASETSQFTTVDTHFITGKDPRHLAFGAQYTHYRGKNGLDISLMLNPGKDNPEISRKVHPLYPNVPINSWRMEILDLGTTRNHEGIAKPNMQMVCERYADYYFVSTGKWSKKTGMPINDGGEANSAVGGYSCHAEKSFGLLIRDRSRMALIMERYDD